MHIYAAVAALNDWILLLLGASPLGKKNAKLQIKGHF